MSIKGFRDEYFWLSNMYTCIIQWQGLCFSSTESAYQASKVTGELAKPFQMMTGKQAKAHVKTLYVRKTWQDIKYNVMAQLVFQKFLVHDDLRQKLLDTGDCYIEETNTWNDTYWGVCNGVGENNLGKILMNTREYFKNK